jgi:hypothetical protein
MNRSNGENTLNNGSPYGCERLGRYLRDSYIADLSKWSETMILAKPFIGIVKSDFTKRSLDMRQRLVKIVVGLSLLFVGMLAIVSCVPGDYTNAEAASSSAVSAGVSARADAASLARWEGLGERYAALSRAEHKPDGSADVSRWQAKGEYFAALANTQLHRGQAASVARWQAKGEYYSTLNAKAAVQLDADVLRWVAMGESYQQKTEAIEELGADAARWVALGERYQAKNEASVEMSADVARWVALGERYK